MTELDMSEMVDTLPFSVGVSTKYGLFRAKFTPAEDLGFRVAYEEWEHWHTRSNTIEGGLYNFRASAHAFMIADKKGYSSRRVDISHMKHLYLSGPMAGKKDLNKEWFVSSAMTLRDLYPKIDIFSPYEYDFGLGIKEEPSHAMRRQLLNVDMAMVCLWADAIVVLPEWEQSRGARAEVHTAIAVDIPVLFYEDILEVDMYNFGGGE